MAIDQVTPPRDLEIVEITKSSVDLRWKKPESDGGAKITGYIIERMEASHARWLKCNFSNVMQCHYTVTGLVENECYEFRVCAKNAAGSISEPSESTDPVECQDSFSPPRVDIDPNLKDMIFSKPGDDVKISAAIFGKPAPKVKWIFNEMPLESSSKTLIESTVNNTSLIIKGVDRNDSGKYILNLENCAGFR